MTTFSNLPCSVNLLIFVLELFGCRFRLVIGFWVSNRAYLAWEELDRSSKFVGKLPDIC